MSGFNTQPPEGGWGVNSKVIKIYKRFQHTAARRRLVRYFGGKACKRLFQHTAARRRLGKLLRYQGALQEVSTHSRPKAAGSRHLSGGGRRRVSTHSRPKAAGGSARALSFSMNLFQHTAARRRLGTAFFILPATDCFNTQPPEGGWVAQGCAVPR